MVEGLILLDAGADAPVLGEDGGGVTEAGGDAAGCGDTTTSADNCGACGHKCITTACVAGRCQAQVLVTGAPIADYSGYVGVNASLVVWANKPTRGVYSAPKGGGIFQQYFGTTAFTPTTLDVHETFFVFSDYDLYGVAKYTLPGTASEDPRAESCATGLGAVADETGAVYYAHLNDTGPCTGAIFHITKRVPTGGGTYTTAWDIPVSNFSVGASKWMVVDANNLYFDSSFQPPSNPNGIYAMPRNGGAGVTPSLVLAGGFLASPMALDGTTLYTIEFVSSATPSVVAIDLPMKTKRLVAKTEHAFFEAGSNARAQIAVDATHVYWTAAVGTENPSTGGRVLRARKDGSDLGGKGEEIVVDTEPSLFGMTIDQSFVYWSTASAIKRVAK